MFSLSCETYSLGHKYLLLTHEGEINIQAILENAPRIAVAIEHHKCLKLVEDYRMATLNMSATELTKAQSVEVDSLGSSGIQFTQLKRAMVIDESTISSEELEFFKMLSINNGQTLMIFTDLYKAIKWINEDIG
jgi:hypothetical protein